MFVVLVNYVKPLAEVDAVLADHVRFLDGLYAAGVLVASGRRVPRTGGVLLARAEGREQLAEVLARDPFALAGVAEYEIVEFLATKTSPELDFLRDAPAQ